MPLLGSRGAASTTGFGALANLGYFLRNSLRFRSSASARLTRTYGATGNAQKFTASAWVKRGALGSTQTLFGAQNTSAQTWDHFSFNSSDQLQFFFDPGTTPYNVITSSVFRDPSAWYHIVCAVDTTQATASNRVRIYVNGVEQSQGTNTLPQNYNTRFNVNGNTAGVATQVNYAATLGPVSVLDGYLAEVNFIDNQQLTPSSFGKTDAATNQWIPKKFAGTYGTNGFYLKFADASAATAAAIGKDSSPNGNNWTPNNISVTAGVTYDAMIDSPTLTSATAANYAVMNPLIKSYASQSWALTNGNLQATDSGSGGGWCLGTIAATSGKWYWEGTITAVAKAIGVGWTTISNISFSYNGCYQSGGNVNNASGTLATTFASFTTNDVIGVAVDVSSGKVWFSKNGTFLGSGDPVAGTNTAFTFTGGTESAPTFCIDNSAGTSGVACNFGQRPFSYTPPSGYKSLNTYNLP